MDRNVYQPSQLPFEATTNYQTEYLAKKLDPAKIVKPIEQVNESGPFEGDTHYRQACLLLFLIFSLVPTHISEFL